MSYSSTLSCPHDTPPGPDHTCLHSYHAGYSETNLPPLLFVIERYDSAHGGGRSPLMVNDEPVLDWRGRPIRDYRFLPRYISTHPPGWLLEYWFRTNTRLTYRDIKARMTVPPRHLPSERELDARRELEARGPLALSDLRWRRIPITRREIMRAEMWSLEQIHFNTTLDIELGHGDQPARLRKKALGPDGTVTTVGQPTMDLRAFLNRGEMVHFPQQRLRDIFEVYHQVRDRAVELGYSSWQLLPANELPSTWDESNSIEQFTYDWYQQQEDIEYDEELDGYPDAPPSQG